MSAENSNPHQEKEAISSAHTHMNADVCSVSTRGRFIPLASSWGRGRHQRRVEDPSEPRIPAWKPSHSNVHTGKALKMVLTALHLRAERGCALHTMLLELLRYSRSCEPIRASWDMFSNVCRCMCCHRSVRARVKCRD